MGLLSDSDSDSENDFSLTINEHYAKAFEYKKEREELEKLKEKYGSDYDEGEEDSEDSEDDESEDEDGEELTPAVDAAILKTLARIKRKDPEIYDTQKDIFEEEQQRVASVKVASRSRKDKSGKPITIRQVALESALHATSRSPSPSPKLMTHVEEQRALRDETIAAFHAAASDEEDDLLIPREKTKDEVEMEEEEYRNFLQREVGDDLNGLVTIDTAQNMAKAGDNSASEEEGEELVKERKKHRKHKDKAVTKGKSTEQEDQAFLLDYILNRGWIDRSANRIPTYREVTKPSKKGKAKATPVEDAASASDSSSSIESEAGPSRSQLDEDEFDDVVDRFESSYNFRFEEPDAAVIKAYPRMLPSVVRREDTKRKEARERKKQRKEDELAKKREEVKRMKALKMKEIRAKLEKIGREGGRDLENDPALQELDLDAAWDPEAHERQMAGLYAEDEDEAATDDEKPQWDDDIDTDDIIPAQIEAGASTTKKSKKKKKERRRDGLEDEEEGVDIDAMDADIVPGEDEDWDGTEEMRKRKLDEYMDEVYGLEFNDMVGDLPTRFHYVPVQPQNFALTPAEILMATDAELNEYMGVKKYAPYRQDKPRWDPNHKDKLHSLKQKVTERMDTLGIDSKQRTSGDQSKAKRKGKKERMRMKASAAENEQDDAKPMTASHDSSEATIRKRKHENVSEHADAEVAEDMREDAMGKKRRRHRGKRQDP